MNEQEMLRQAKLDKLARLHELFVDPYPYAFKATHSIALLLADQEKCIAEEKKIRLTGRIFALRKQGKTSFVNIKQAGAKIQLYFNREVMGDQAYDVFKCMDIGDIIGVSGVLFKTQRGETSLKVETIDPLCKSIRPFPIPKVKIEDGKEVVFDQFSDIEQRYRQRYLDLLLNDESAMVFRKRSLIISSIRRYLEGNGYLEVETPTLQPIYGGANARPFLTHHNALDMKLYLRVSNELYLKRCIIGGFERVYEFVKNFRNEGIDRTHCPEFTLLEFYESYADYNEMMVHFERIYAEACLAVNGSMRCTYQGHEIDFTPPWPRLTMKAAIRQYGGFDVDEKSDDELIGLLKAKEVQMQGRYIRGRAIEEIFAVYCEDKLIRPTFIIDHPKETTPLCKSKRGDDTLIERFEPYINGWEVGNAYSEMTDPKKQRELLLDQVERGRGGEEETHPMDEDFLRAMEYGMPPTGGVGIGIDRMVMLLTDQRNIRDVILFPLLKLEE